MPYKRILVPFDGSKFSKKAVDEAIQIAQLTGGIIYLCTVIGMSSIVPPGSMLGLTKGASTGKLKRKLIRSAKIQAEQMEQSQVSYCNSRGVNAYYKIIVDGHVTEEILKVAKKKAADLIVIGSQGLHGVSKIKSLGSVSRKVSELASCPVLIVR